MKILYLDWNCYCGPDVYYAFMQMKNKGVTVIRRRFEPSEDRDNPAFRFAFSEDIKKHRPDVVFSMNYFPDVSKVCEAEQVRYMAWVYDEPQVALFNYTVINKCNIIFVFDSGVYRRFSSQGIETVHYMPLAAAPQRLLRTIGECEDSARWKSEISFVGSLYNEGHNYYDRIKESLLPETRDFLEDLMRRQLQCFSGNFVEESLDDAVLSDMTRVLGLTPNRDGVETPAYLYGQYVINRKITSTERTEILSMLKEKYPVHHYSKTSELGPVEYFREMPLVFGNSKINLNITLRSIVCGVPLRCFDICGCGGFLLTDRRPDMDALFEPDKEAVSFESREELMDKVSYYLSHDAERQKIAGNGLKRVQAEHTFDARLTEMMGYI